VFWVYLGVLGCTALQAQAVEPDLVCRETDQNAAGSLCIEPPRRLTGPAYRYRSTSKAVQTL